MRMGNEEDPRDLRYMSEAEMMIQAARTGFGGKGKPLSDREIIRHLTSSCFSDDDLYEQARKFAPAMGWDIEEFVEQARRIGRYG